MRTINYKSQSAEAVNSAVKYNVVTKGYDACEEGFDTLDDAIDYVMMMIKKHPSDTIYVNGKRIRLEKELDGKWSVSLRDAEWKLIAGYVMGKIKRGLRDAVAHVLGYIEVDEDEVEENSHFGDDYENFNVIKETERVVDTIEKYLGSYTPSYLDQFGECVITIYWDEFNEDDMKMLIEDDIFAKSVRDILYDRGVIESLSGFLVYDDGVYVTVDYDKMFNKVKVDENDTPCLDDAEDADVVKNDTPCLEDCENVRDYLNNDERAFFVLPDYDYVCGLFVEYNEDDDIYVAMGNESWNVTEYDGNTDMSVVIADFSNAWAKEIDEYCDFYKGLEYDRKIYRNDDYDAYMILLNSGVSHGLNVEEGYDPYKGDYVEVIA